LAAAVARAPHLRADQRVRVSVEDGQVVMRRIADTGVSLEQRCSSAARRTACSRCFAPHGRPAAVSFVPGIGCSRPLSLTLVYDASR